MNPSLTLRERLAINIAHEAANWDPQGHDFKLHEKDPQAPRSPLKFQLRTPHHSANPGNLSEESLALMGQLWWNLLKRKGLTSTFTAVAGIPEAGDPMADALLVTALRYGWGGYQEPLRLRKVEVNGHRRIANILNVANFKMGTPLVMVDDVMGAGDSKAEAIDLLRGQWKFNIKAVLVGVDWELGGAQWIARHLGVPVYPIFSVSKLLRFWLKIEAIEKSEKNAVHKFRGALKRRGVQVFS